MALPKPPKTIKALFEYTNKRFDELWAAIKKDTPEPPIVIPPVIPPIVVTPPPVIVPPVVVTPPVIVPPIVTPPSTGNYIDEGSDILNLAENNFKVGDSLIIETGGEQGKGLRGTIGVGGQWPYYIYNTFAQMVADTGKVQGFYAGCEENGNVYRSDNGAWIKYTKWGYYLEKIVPHSLDAKVIAVDGSKITLDKKAKVSAKDFNVYKDSWSEYQEKFNDRTVSVIEFPAGKFYFSWQLYMLYNDNNVIIKGAGVDKTFLISPNGSPSMSMYVHTNRTDTRPEVRGLTIIGNGRFNGFRFLEDEIKQPLPTSEAITNESLWLQTQGVCVANINGIIENVNVIDGFGYSTELVSQSGGRINNCNIKLTEGEKQYTGWQIHALGNNEGQPTIVSNCTFESPTLTHAWEGFQTYNTIFLNNKSINGLFAFNGAENCTVENFQFTNTANAYDDWKAPLPPVFDINSFLGGSDKTVLKNVNITQVKMKNGVLLNGIYGRYNTTNVEIIGGSFTTPDQDINTSAQAIHIEATNALVDGFIVNGTLDKYYHDYPTMSSASIAVYPVDGTNTGQGTGTVKNSKADIIKVADGVITENNVCSICK